MELNEKLAVLRKNSGYSTRELGEKLGVSQSSISLWEKGDRRPDFENIVKLANIYGVSTDYLLGSDNNKSEINKLNELINFQRMEMNKLNVVIGQLTEDIDSLEHKLRMDIKFKESIELDESDNNDKELLKLIYQRILRDESLLNEKMNQREKSINKLKKSEEDIYLLEEKYRLEKVNELQLNDSLKRMESNNFESIMITNEYQLQVIILKYLGIYDTYNGTMLSVEEIMQRVKKIINENKFL